MNKTAIVIGAGIAGLAVTRALAEKKYAVKVIERSSRAVGASIRNFGMVWPIGQPEGELYEMAMHSRSIWKQVSATGAFWSGEAGSLHLAYAQDEWQVLQELETLFAGNRQVRLLSPGETGIRSSAVVQQNLQGALFSPDELIVDPREAIGALPGYLSETYAVEFFWDRCVSYISDNTVYIGSDENLEADIIFVCSGADFETLFPEELSRLPLTKCKLQMMRMAPQPNNWRMGPALCGALSLAHYNSFKGAPSLPKLLGRFNAEMSDYLNQGIHVMVSQNERGELTVGDSHEYGQTHDPFDKSAINELIIKYLNHFAAFPNNVISETWSGIYPKLTNGDPYIFFSPQDGVHIFNGLGGAGMTLAFAAAEDSVDAVL